MVAWNDDVINAVVDHADQHVAATSSEGDTTALVTTSRHLESGALADKRTAASLPRGFAFFWQSGDDHHMLQTGYHLDHEARFVERDKPYDRQLLDPPLIEPESRVAPEIVTWQSFGIFKDNDRRRNYVFEEHASALGGDDVESSIRPSSCCRTKMPASRPRASERRPASRAKRSASRGSRSSTPSRC